MRKLLLRTNCFIALVLLSSCQISTKNKGNIESITTETIVNKDSSANLNVDIQNDTTKKITHTSIHIDKQTKTANSSNSKQTNQTPSGQTIRIEHGSENQAKIDSIKKAKGKLKK